MKKLLRVLIFLTSLVAQASASTYQLNPGPFSIEDFGSPLQSNVQEHRIMFRDKNGDKHLLMYYVTDSPTYFLQVLDINLDKETSHLVDGVKGRPGTNATVYDASNGKIYLGSSDPGYFMEYDPLTHIARTIAPLHWKGNQHSVKGDDGSIYLGEITSVEAFPSRAAGLERYNPATDTFENLGLPDPTFIGPLQYCYTVGADTRYVYVGLGQSPWYLAVYDTVTKTYSLHWKDENDTAGTVYKGVSGGWFYDRVNSAQSWYRKWYKLENGVPTEILPSEVPPLVDFYHRGGISNGTENSALFTTDYGIEFNFDEASPDSSTGNQAVIRWRTVGDATWKSLTISNFKLSNATIKRLYPWKDNSLLGLAGFYGPVFTYSLSTHILTPLGRPQRSLYNAIIKSDTVYLSGYPAVTLKYQPANPWTLSGSVTNIRDSSVNPYQITTTANGQSWDGKYHYYSAEGSDGLIYIGVHHERDSFGGGLGWYNPVNGSGGGLRDPFLDYDVRDLKSVLNGTKIVFVSSKDKIFVFDVASKTIEREIIPIPGIASLDKVVEVEPGVIVGFADKQFYKVDIRTGQILYVENLGGTAMSGMATYDRRLVKGPDNFVWLFIDNKLSRIDPVSKTIQTISTTAVSNILFHGVDLYFYGGATIRCIKNIFTEVPSVVTPPINPSGGNQFYVSPSGLSGNDGGMTSPWNLQTALNHPASVKPGDIIWLREGTYVGAYTSKLVGTENAPIVVRAFPGERVIVDGGMEPSALFQMQGAFTWIWGLEMTCSNPKRVFSQLKLSNRTNGITDSACNGCKYINNIIHDINGDINAWNSALNTEVYGNIGFNGGIDAADRGHCHGLYTQNSVGTKKVGDNIWFGHLGGFGLHAYTEGGFIDNFVFDGNIAFRGTFLVGGLKPAHNIVVTNNHIGSGSSFRLGYSNVLNQNVTIENNFLRTAGELKYWSGVKLLNNTFADGFNVTPQPSFNISTYQIDSNQYYLTAPRFSGLTDGSFASWQSQGLDPNGSFVGTLKKGVDVFVRPNKFESGRAHVVVYNWDGVDSVAVDLTSSGLGLNDAFEVRDVQNVLGPPVFSGNFTGTPVTLPLNLTTRARYFGDFTNAYHQLNETHTSKEFNVFLVTRKGTSFAPPKILDTQAPTIPTQLAGKALSMNKINLSWTASTDNVGVTGYKIYRNTASIAVVPGLSYIDTGLTAATAYSYVVSAVDAAANESALLNPIVVTTLSTLNEADPSEQADVNTKLNPHRGESIVVGSFLNGEQGTIEIMDRKGVVVRSFPDADAQTVWNGRNQNGDVVSSGIYLVKYPKGQKKVVVVK